MIDRRSIAWLVLSTLTPFLVSPAYALPASRDIAIEAIQDDNADEESAEVAATLRQSFQLTTPHHLIDPGLARDVLDYHGVAGGETELETPIRNALEAGKDHYYHFAYDDAAAEIERAVALAETTFVAEPRVGGLLVDALLVQGVIAHAQLKMDQAHTSFARALSVNPMATLDPQYFPPSLVAVFEAERTQMATRPRGSLEVVTDPPVAEVFLNGTLQGVTPLTLSNVPVGRYVLSIETNRYRPIERRLAIVDGATFTVKERLQWEEKSAKQEPLRRESRSEITRGLMMANALKADRVILVNADRDAAGEVTVTSRMVDREYAASLVPLAVRYDAQGGARSEVLTTLAKSLIEQASLDPRDNPAEFVDPPGGGNPKLLAGRKKRDNKPLMWGTIGVAAAGALAGGLIAALSKGDPSPSTGSVEVSFK